MDYGFVGDIDSVNAAVIEKLLENGLMPVVSPLSADAAGMLLNINADTVAAAIGGALPAEKLCCARGRRAYSRAWRIRATVISYTDIRRAEAAARAGQIRELACCPRPSAIEEAIRGGVHRVHVITYKSPDGLLAEIFTNGDRHAVVADVQALSRPSRKSVASQRRSEGDARMTRLWDKGAPLDERVLEFTVGEDYCSMSASSPRYACLDRPCRDAAPDKAASSAGPQGHARGP